MQVFEIQSDSEDSEQTCPFCGFNFFEGDHVVQCNSCQRYCHYDCWQTNSNRCSTLGCNSRGAITQTSIKPLLPNQLQQTTNQVIRLRPRDLARIASPSRSPDPQTNPSPSATRSRPHSPSLGIWKFSLSTMLLTAVVGIAFGFLYRFTGEVLIQIMGSNQVQETFLLPYLIAAGQQFNIFIWAVLGGIYGLLHRGYLMGKRRSLYQVVRLFSVILYTGAFTFQLGFLIFTPGYLWPEAAWGFFSKVLWMAPIFAWGFLLMVVLSAFGLYSTRLTIVEPTLGFFLIAIAVVVVGYLYAALFGFPFGAIGWLLGSLVEIISSGADYSAIWSGWGISIGGAIGMFSGVSVILDKTNNSS